MTVSLTSAVIEMEFSGVGAGWTAVTADVLASPSPRWEYGIRSNDPVARVASTGMLTFALNNSVRNSGAKQGYYSPGHANIRTGFEVGIQVRLSLTYSATTYRKFIGRINSIQVVAGLRREQQTFVAVTDWMEEAALIKAGSNTPGQEDKRADQIISLLLDAASVQPTATSLEQGVDIFPFSSDIGDTAKTTLMREIVRVAQSELGYVYIRGDTSTGGVLVFEDRHFRIEKTTSEATLDNTMVELKPNRERPRVRNKVRVTVHPRVVDADPTAVLFSLDYAPQVRAGQSITIEGNYTDPDNASRQVGGLAVIVPQPNTDYQVNSDDTGYSAALTIDQKGKILSTYFDDLIAYWTLDDDTGLEAKDEVDIYGDRNGVLGTTTAKPTMGATGIGDGRTAFSFDGGDFVNIYSSELAAVFDGAKGTVEVWVRITDAAVWADATVRYFIRLGADANNHINIRRTATNNTLGFQYVAGGTSDVVTDSSLAASTDWFLVALTWDSVADELKAYINGAQVGSTQTGLGAWAGSLASNLCVLGAISTAGANGHKGLLQHAPVWADRVLSAAEILAIYQDQTGGCNVDAMIGGFSTKYTITNRNDSPVYVTLLQARGKRVQNYQPITQEEIDQDSIDDFGEVPLDLDMPYQDSPLVGKDAALYLLTNLAQPATEVETISLVGNRSDALMLAALGVEPGDRVTLTEDVTGLDTDFFVNGVVYTLDPGNILKAQWHVVPAKDSAFWAIGVAGFSEIGETTFVVY